MFPYRGLAVLIALCAFGAIQASFLGRDDYHRFKHGLQQGNFNSSNSSGNSNVTLPSGNYSHPGHFNSSGNWSRPVRSHRPHRFNSSNVGNSNSSYVPSWNATGHGFRPRPGNFSNPGNFSSSFPQGQRPAPVNFNTSFNSPPQERGWFNRRPSYGNSNSSRVPAVNRPVYRPVYRPAVNSTWSRPSNSSWNYSG